MNPDKLFKSVRQKENIIYFFDGINPRTALEFVQLLDYNPHHDICIKLHTTGGQIESALVMYNAIKSSNKHFTIINEGSCYSAGTIILAAGNVKLSRKYSAYLIHSSRVKNLSGKYDDIRDHVYNADMLMNFYQDIICNSIFTRSHLMSIIEDEKFLTPSECLDFKLIDVIC